MKPELQGGSRSCIYNRIKLEMEEECRDLISVQGFEVECPWKDMRTQPTAIADHSTYTHPCMFILGTP
jgi:hypothetical protein